MGNTSPSPGSGINVLHKSLPRRRGGILPTRIPLSGLKELLRTAGELRNAMHVAPQRPRRRRC